MTLPATITPSGAADRVWDVAVVGAGPAGAVAAYRGARGGADVLLIDKAVFPRGKVCGCCLNGNALEALAVAGLGTVPTRLGAIPLRRVVASAGGRAATIILPTGVSLSREALDAEFIREAVGKGVSFLPGTAASLGEVHNGVRRVHFGSTSTAARVVVVADGLNGRVIGNETIVRPGSRIGAGTVIDSAPAFFTPGTVFMATGRGGYVGLVRLEDGRLDVAAALDAAFVRAAGGPGQAAVRILGETHWPAIPGLRDVKWKGTPPLTRTPKRVAGERWFAIGDAAGYVEPFTGEGIAWAVGSGIAVADLALTATRQWDDRLPSIWRKRLTRVVGERRRVCRVVAAGLRYPVVTRVAIRLLAALPGIAGPVLRTINRPPSLSHVGSPE